MKEILIYILFIMFITVIIPITLVQGCDIVSDNILENNIEKVEEEKYIEIYNTKTNQVEKMDFEEYIKGVVAAEMPAEFHIEALRAQAVAARTYALDKINKFKDGHPDHPEAALCNGVHCQAWLSMDELRNAHGAGWTYDYWPKIEEAVDSTKGQIITYAGKTIEPLFHSVSGGMTEDSEDVFASEVPYLRGVESPHEEDSPFLRDTISMTIDEFINKLEQKYPNAKLTKQNLPDKIKVAEKSEGGKIMKLMIGSEVVSGRDIRTLFNLRSTNFKIRVTGDIVEIETLGYGHGVGMSQWGANGMANSGSTYEEILKHYYTGVELEQID